MTEMDTDMTESLARRAIIWSNGLTIDKQGVVWNGKVREPTTVLRTEHGVKQIATVIVTQEETRVIPIWKLLSFFWYDKKIVLPRDGNAMDYSTKNVIVVGNITFSKNVPGIFDADEVLLIWARYCQGVSCFDMSSETKLYGYSIDSFRSLIGDILLAGIR